jgi:hypothetical protein
MGAFSRTVLVLSGTPGTVAPVTVYLYENQNFWVDPNVNATGLDGGPLPYGAYPRPFTVTDCKKYLGIFRVAKLNMDSAAVADWQGIFASRTPILIGMQLANNTAPQLQCELTVGEPSIVSSFLRQVQGVAVAFLYFAIAVVTLEIFRPVKSVDGIGKAARTDAR